MLKRMLLVLVFILSITVMALAAENINTADEKALAALPSIGPAKATAIVGYRKDHGNFKNVDDLKKVKGIGVKTIEKLRDQIAVEE